MTFRAGKRHKVQESGRPSKNVLRLASRLQHFLNTGKASKQDLKAIDKQFSSLVSEQGDKILKLLDQLRDRVPKTRGKDAIDLTCQSWAKWLSGLDSKDTPGFSSIRTSSFESETQGALLEAVVDADADLFRMLLAFNSSLATLVRKASYEVPDSKEIVRGAEEIYEAYDGRRKILSRITGQGEKISLRGGSRTELGSHN